VIANANVPESVKLAEEYMQRRQIPKENYFAVRCSTAEEISREEFVRDIWNPLKKWAYDSEYLVDVNPNDHPWKMNSPYMSGILWFVTTYGMPLRIAEHYEPGEAGWHAPAERNAASVDSELATWPVGPGKMAGPIPNPLYRPNEEFAWSLVEPRNDVMTLVARLDGPTYEIASDLMNRTDYKEKYGLGGQAYIDSQGLKEGANQPLDEMLRKGARFMEIEGGVSVHLDTNLETFSPDVPMITPCAYVGWYAPHVTGPILNPKFKFWPGAIAYQLHPWSAASLRTTDRFWAGPMLARGAGLVIGNVFDPGLDGYTRPDIVLHALSSIRHSSRAMEVVWSATPYLSWSTVFIGEPTYIPFTGTLEMLDRLYKAGAAGNPEVYEGADVPLRTKRWRHYDSPADTDPIRQTNDIIEKKGWEHPDLLEFLGDMWSTSELNSPSTGFETYERVAALTRYPWQRSRVRVSGAKLLLSVTDPKDLKDLAATYPRFNTDLTELAMGQLKKAIEQDPKEPATADAYSLLATLYGEKGEEAKRLDVMTQLAANLPNTAAGLQAAGELWVKDRNRPNPFPTLSAAPTELAPTLDGESTELCWKDAKAAMPPTMKEIGVSAVPSPVELSATYDANTLYLFVKCPFNSLTESELLGRAEQPDKERIGVYLSSRRDYKTACQIAVTRGGGVQAIRDDGAAWLFNTDWFVTKRSPDGGWDIEIAIPLAEFGQHKPQAGDVWGLSFRRQRVVRAEERLDTITTSWVGRYGDLDEVSRFGYLVFE